MSPVFLDLESWHKAEVLHLRDGIERLESAFARGERAVTRHHAPESDVFLIVSWDRGVGDYARLRSRDEFLQEQPQEAVVADCLTWRSKRVDFAGVSLDPAGPFEGPAFTARVLAGLAALRSRCQLGKGYIVWLDVYFLDHLSSLALFDRRLNIERRRQKLEELKRGS